MTIRTLSRMGNPQIVQISEPVKHEEFNTPELDELVNDMFDTMHAFKGVGIAAPQIGVPKRVIIFGFEKNARYPYAEPVPTTVLINPEIILLNDEVEEGWEGCLSVTGLRGLVPRYKHLKYHGYNQNGVKIEREAHGFHAIVVQHECDHLDGILFPRRIQDLTNFGFEEELNNTLLAFNQAKQKPKNIS